MNLYDKAFEEFYKDKLEPELIKLEKSVKWKWNYLWYACLLMISVGLIIWNYQIIYSALISMNIFEQNDDALDVIFLFLILCLVFIILLVLSVFPNAAKADRSYKKHVLLPALRALFQDVRYIPRQRLSKQVVEKSLLFNSDDDMRYGEDYLEFTLDGVKIQSCEYRSRLTSKASQLFMTLSFHKDFTSKTILMPRDSFLKSFQRFASGFSLSAFVRKMEDMERVRLESHAFKKAFKVYSANQVEARYILTPSMMARIMKYQLTTGSPLFLSFTGNRFYIKIITDKPFLERTQVPVCDIENPGFLQVLFPKSKPKLNSLELLREQLAPVDMMADVVHDLNLNVKIWTS
ncbi:MAG: DUF3137 domain-containing protein [Bacteroidales bacterium]